ncbi:helix-turn-helix domain-containing protein [Rhizobium deserti]|nr:helix-turn-helix domain-containing protein [Rhizobium deserti]
MRLRGFSKQMAFASEIGVSESVVSRWQRGNGLSLANTIRVCEVLDISLDWLLLGRGTMEGHRPPANTGPRDRLQKATAQLPDTVINAMSALAEAIQVAEHPDRR